MYIKEEEEFVKSHDDLCPVLKGHGILKKREKEREREGVVGDK